VVFFNVGDFDVVDSDVWVSDAGVSDVDSHVGAVQHYFTLWSTEAALLL